MVDSGVVVVIMFVIVVMSFCSIAVKIGWLIVVVVVVVVVDGVVVVGSCWMICCGWIAGGDVQCSIKRCCWLERMFINHNGK